VTAVSDRPEHGVRYELVRVDHGRGEDAGVTVYRGHAHMKTGSLPLEARVDHASGGASARIDGSGSEAALLRDLEKGAAALVRATARPYLADGRPPPRRILRWRERPAPTTA
jgi:hypothetical protein